MFLRVTCIYGRFGVDYGILVALYTIFGSPKRGFRKSLNLKVQN